MDTAKPLLPKDRTIRIHLDNGYIAHGRLIEETTDFLKIYDERTKKEMLLAKRALKSVEVLNG